MHAQRKQVLEALYRAGNDTLDMTQVEILEALQRVGFSMISPPLSGGIAEISVQLAKKENGAKPTESALVDGLNSASLDLPPDETVSIFGVLLSAPRIVSTLGRKGTIRFLDFFAHHLTNRNTRRAYGVSIGNFLFWCEEVGVKSFAAVRTQHILQYFDTLKGAASSLTVEQRLSAIRSLFDWMMAGDVIWGNPIPSTGHIRRRNKQREHAR